MCDRSVLNYGSRGMHCLVPALPKVPPPPKKKQTNKQNKTNKQTTNKQTKTLNIYPTHMYLPQSINPGITFSKSCKIHVVFERVLLHPATWIHLFVFK